MTLFKTSTAQSIWIEHHCDRCWRQDGCRILERAIRTDRKPAQWERNSRASLMQDAYKCSEFSHIPTRPKREQQFEDVPMFDVEPTDAQYVPVPGWPERAPKQKEGDHA